MIQKIVFVLGLSVIGGILGRLGGKAGCNTKVRDIGVPCVFTVLLWLLGAIQGLLGWLWLIPSFFLMFLALTSYRYFLPKPKDYQWWHYSLHAFMVSLAIFPFIFSTGHWLGFGIRCVINTIGVGLLSYFISWDDAEEFSRYFLITLTTPLLLV